MEHRHGEGGEEVRSTQEAMVGKDHEMFESLDKTQRPRVIGVCGFFVLIDT